MIVDTTYNTNKFQIMLYIIIVIDNNYRIRIIACAIIKDEIMETYRWIFDNILTDTDSFLRVIFTNSDPFII